MTRKDKADTEEPPIVNAADFVPAKFDVKFSNLTSRSEVKEKDAKGIILEEIDGSRLTLGLPAASCSRGHSVMVEIKRVDRLAGKAEPFKATGKVVHVAESKDGDGLRATIDLVQYDEESWTKFLKFFADRQDEITDFLLAVKGT